ncbi:hypothetical protein ABZ746_34805 [Streptomyces sp. NPDC020096]
MSTGRNLALIAWMTEHQISSRELAEQVNDAVGELTGRRGGLDDSSIRAWRRGAVRCPKAAQLRALEMVTGRTAVDLGFACRGQPPGSTAPPEEDPVLRRRFFTATAGAALPTVGRRTVGAADANRIRVALDRLRTADQTTGGTADVESGALGQANAALNLVHTGSASTRVRNMLFAVAADATITAAWAAIDGHRRDTARRHLEQAMTLAAMSGDGHAQFRAWNSLSMLSAQEGKATESLAAAQAMRATPAIRKDPLFASLAHARVALAHASLGERTSATRALDHARAAMGRAGKALRPAWFAFYDQAELDGLTCATFLDVRMPDQAEYHAHRALSAMSPALVRNRALYSVDLATAQLRQLEVEQAVTTARNTELLAASIPGSGRIRAMLDTFRTELRTIAPNATAVRDYLNQ